MARIRSIKPELRTSITVSSWPREVRYFFILLWGYLDDYGRGVDDELLIASDCFPRDRDIVPDTVDAWLELMADSGPLCRYEVDSRRYLHCPNWREHQKPQHPTRSKIPPCPDDEPEDFETWRKSNPERFTKRSRKSREELRKISPVFSGASLSPSGGVSDGPLDDYDATIIHMPGQLAAVNAQSEETAGQSAYGDSHELLVNRSGDSPEHFTPEQGSKGARELGRRGNEPAAENAPAADTAPAAKAARKRATSAPRSITVTNDMRAWAADKGLDSARVDRETERFLDHHLAKGTTFKDWTAAWRTWMSRATDYTPQQATGTHGRRYSDPADNGVF